MESRERIANLAREALRSLRPLPRLTVSEWADTYRRLSPESSAEPGQWNTTRAEYQREIMNVLNDPRVGSVVLMTSAQIGKTAILENIVGYHIAQDPSPILCLQPTLEMAQAFSKDRLATMLRDTPALQGLVRDPRARDSGNTMLHKTFPGGHITITGANSPAQLASRPIRIVLCDEVDRYPASAGSEGDPVNLARKRTATFWNRKVMLTSTPTIKNLSRIEAAFLASDQRHYHVPCPHCEAFQVLRWESIRWTECEPESAAYYCRECGARIEESEKPRMLVAGKWVATAEFTGTAGFHINELYSPWRRWAEVVADFLEAKQGGTEMLKAWVNTSLGEPWEEQGDGVEATGLLSRVENYEQDDLQLLAVTAGVDVQRDRIEASFVGWGAKEEGWLIDHVIIPGDTAGKDVWIELADLIAEYRPVCVAVDSGFNASQVYAFAKKYRFCRAIKGVSGMNRPLVEDDRQRAKRLRSKRKSGGYPVEPVGVDGGKVLVYSRLRVPAPGPGYIHFPDHPAFDTEYFDQLSAERLVTQYRFGRPIQKWTQIRARNEALDCLVYAFAALYLWGGLDRAAIMASRKSEGEGNEQVQDGRPRRRVVSVASKPDRTGMGFFTSLKG